MAVATEALAAPAEVMITVVEPLAAAASVLAALAPEREAPDTHIADPTTVSRFLTNCQLCAILKNPKRAEIGDKMAASLALIRHKSVSALALSFPLRCRASPSALHHSLFRTTTPASSSRLILRDKSTASDDPSFVDNSDYEALKRSRPVRISARLINPNRDSTNSAVAASTPTTTRIVHFQRHGQGTHNEIYRQWSDSLGQSPNLSETDPTKNPLLTERVLDAPLTQKGREQCVAQRPGASKLKEIELVVVSPLVRALQTAHITFGEFLPSQKLGSGTKWIAHEGIREELGLLLCNKRQSLSATMAAFPKVDYTHLLPHREEDATWNEYAARTSGDGDAPQRETTVDMSHRAYRFLVDFLRARPEKEMAVVGHSAWLFAMTNAVLDIEEGQSSIGPMFAQAELRSMELVFSEQ